MEVRDAVRDVCVMLSVTDVVIDGCTVADFVTVELKLTVCVPADCRCVSVLLVDNEEVSDKEEVVVAVCEVVSLTVPLRVQFAVRDVVVLRVAVVVVVAR